MSNPNHERFSKIEDYQNLQNTDTKNEQVSQRERENSKKIKFEEEENETRLEKALIDINSISKAANLSKEKEQEKVCTDTNNHNQLATTTIFSKQKIESDKLNSIKLAKKIFKPLFNNSSSLIKLGDQNNDNNHVKNKYLKSNYCEPRLYNLKNHEYHSKTTNDIQKRIHYLKKLSHDKLFEMFILKKNLYRTYRKLSKDPLHKLSITQKSSNTDFVKKILYKYTNPLVKVDNQKIIEKSKLPSLKSPNKKQISLSANMIHYQI